MLSHNAVALREWAALCDLLGSGDQILLLRSGGIHERAFRGPGEPTEHREFWLLPTYLHESIERLVPSARDRFERVAASAPPAGSGRIWLYAVVSDALFIDTGAQLDALAPFHVYAPGYLQQRFDFRETGLWAVLLRVYRRDEAYARDLGPEHVGCVSWVGFDPPLATASLTPVLDEASFELSRARVLGALERVPS